MSKFVILFKYTVNCAGSEKREPITCMIWLDFSERSGMAKDSKIEWTHHTFNPWWGCERVSAACKNCYAETWAHRLGLDLWSKGAARRMLGDSYWRQPVAWNQAAGRANRRDRVFCASMADVFEDR